MQDAYAHCAALVRAGDKDRYLASLFAPAERRMHLHALHAFNIELARVGQVVHEPLAGEIRLQWWRDALAGSGHGEVRANPVADALLDTVERCALPVPALIDLIDARGPDLYDDPPPTLAALEDDARKSAAGLFALAALILARDDGGAAGASAGLAFGLTGVLQAFPFRAARGRVSLPLDVLDRHGVRSEDVLAAQPGPGLAAALATLRARARAHLAEAQRQWPTVPPAAVPAFLPMALVNPLLDRMDRNADPFAPVELPQWRRQWLLWRAARGGLF